MSAHTPDRSILEALEEVRALNQQNMEKCMAMYDERNKLRDINAELLVALKMAKKMNDEAVSQFNWANSALDVRAVWLLNEVPALVEAAIALAEGRQ
jgi:hypothetical protein